MTIAVQYKVGGVYLERACNRHALHFGSAPPEGVESVHLTGPGIAPHHGKIYWGQGGFRYINLTDRPTYLFRGRRTGKLEFELNPYYPQRSLNLNDKLVIGGTIVEVLRLDAPSPGEGQKASLLKRTGWKLEDGAPLQETVDVEFEKLVPLVLQLRQYVSRHELVRQAGDWLFKTLQELHAAQPKKDVHGRRFASVRDVRWFEMRDFEPEFGAEPREGNAASQPFRTVSWLKVIPADASVLSSGKPFRIVACARRKTLALAVAIRMEEADLPQTRGVPVNDRVSAGSRSAVPVDRAEESPAYLFSIELDAGAPRPEYEALLQYFARLVSEALSDLAVRRRLLRVEYERDLIREAPIIFHEMRNQLGQVSTFLSKPPVLQQDEAEWQGFLGRWNRTRTLALDAHDLSLWGMMCLMDRKGCSPQRTCLMAHLNECPRLRYYWSSDSAESRFELLGCNPKFRFSFDKTALSLILVKLIHNAVDSKKNASRRNPVRVSVWVRQARRRLGRGQSLEYVVFRVLDNGDGLAPAEVTSMFQAQFRHATGLGMGTAVVSRLVHWHEGLIEVASQTGVGTAVSVYLPLLHQEEFSRNDPELISFREYAAQRFGAGRWTDFGKAAKEFPSEYGRVNAWMKQRAKGVPVEALRRLSTEEGRPC